MVHVLKSWGFICVPQTLHRLLFDGLGKTCVQLRSCQLSAYLVVDDDVVLGGHIIGDVMIHDESQQPIEQGQIYLLVELLELCLEHDVTLSFA